MASLKEALYEKVSSHDDLSLTSDEDFPEKQPQTSRSPRISTIILSFTTLGFALCSLYLSVWGKNSCNDLSFNVGYRTEWGLPKSSISMQQVTYTSALRYNATSDAYYREFDPTLPQFVGKPSPEIDQAWADLLKGQYLMINEEEASHLDNPVEIMEGIYLAEVEVMHSLHCLNAVRKAITPEYYENLEKHKMPPGIQEMHIDHCIEQLRQTLQCSGDLTPLMLRPWGEGSSKIFIGTPQVHTCRNWDSFRSWYTDRGTEHGSVST